MPSSSNDITVLIRKIEAGDSESVAELWQHCFKRLQVYCRRRLPDHLRRVLDEEDVALSAIKSFCLGAQEGKFGPIEGRDELWKLLYCIAARKAGFSVRHQQALKRGGGQVLGESAFAAGEAATPFDDAVQNGIAEVADAQRAPTDIEHFLNDCEDLFEQLDSDELRTIAILRIEGYSVAEIADRTGSAQRSVERRLNLIRQIWKSAFE